jgi:hypothetical protein
LSNKHQKHSPRIIRQLVCLVACVHVENLVLRLISVERSLDTNPTGENSCNS